MHIGIISHASSWYGRDLMRAGAVRGHETIRLDFPRLVASVGACDEATIRARLPESESGSNAEFDLRQLDTVIVRTMPPGSLEQVVYRMDVLWRLQEHGVTVVNPPKALECAVDKYLTLARLEATGLPVPTTVVCEDADSGMAAFEQLGGDVVVKPLFGSEGRGIVRVSDPDLAFRTFRTLERVQSVLYIQQFVPHDGSDVRVLVLDGQIIAGIRRHSADDFRTNVARQARAEVHAVNDREAELALRAAAATGNTFAGVDLLYDASGRALIIEVNAVPGWRALSRVTGIDVADRVIQSLEQNGVTGEL